MPENVTALDSNLDDPEERARLARSFKRGLNTPAAFVLPVQRWNAVDARRWRSERWSTRAGRVQLVPGDSPAGLRLPLASLPHLDQDDRPIVATRDPFAPLQPLPGTPVPDDDPFAPSEHFISGATGDARLRQQFVEQALRSTVPFAPRSRSNRATDASASSCRRRNPHPTISNSCARLRKRVPNSALRCTSKATCRRTIRASTSSK